MNDLNVRCIIFDDHIIDPRESAGSRAMFFFGRTMVCIGIRVYFCNVGPVKVTIEQEILLLKEGISLISTDECKTLFSKANNKLSDSQIVSVVSRPNTYSYLENMVPSALDQKTIFYGHDIAHLRLQRKTSASICKEPGFDKMQEIQDLMNLEHKIWNNSNITVYPAQDEVEYAKKKLYIDSNSKIYLFPLFGYRHRNFNAYSQARATSWFKCDILFVGNFNHQPNVDGIIWFLENIFPFLKVNRETLRLNIVGNSPPDLLWDYQSSAISIIANPSDQDLSEIYQNAKFTISPISWGAGLNGKIIESIFYETPVVASYECMRAFEMTPPGVFVASTTKEFIAICNRMLDAHGEVDNHVKASMINYIKCNYSMLNMARILKGLLVSIQIYI